MRSTKQNKGEKRKIRMSDKVTPDQLQEIVEMMDSQLTINYGGMSFGDWVLKYDKNDHATQVKTNMKPFEVLFFDVGAEILKNISGYLAASPKKAVQKIRKDVINAIKTVKSGGDVKKIQTLKLQLDKLNKIGGLSAIVPSEGIVFKYKGKTYKFTGAFAPVNQILGLLNF